MVTADQRASPEGFQRQLEESNGTRFGAKTYSRLGPLLPVALIIAVGVAIPLTWYRPHELLVSADFNAPFDPARTFVQSWAGWSNSAGMAGGSTVSLLPLDIPYYGILAFFEVIGFPASLGELFTFSLIFASAGIAMWVLLRRWFGNSASTFAGAFVYMVNPFTLIEWHNGFAVELIGWGLAPLVIFLVEMACSDPILTARFWFGVLFVSVLLAAPGSNPASIIGFVILPLAVVLAFRWPFYQKVLAGWARLGRLGLMSIVALGANLWWLVPAGWGLLHGSLVPGFSHQADTTMPPDLTTPLRPFDLLTGFGYWGWHLGYQGLYFTFEPRYSAPLVRILLVLPLLFGLSALLRRANTVIPVRRIGITLLAVGLFLAAGFHGPFHIFDWAYNHVPGLVVFRSPWQRFGGLQWFGLAVLIAVALSPRQRVPDDELRTRPTLRQSGRWLGAFVVMGLMIGIVNPIFGGMFLNRDPTGRLIYYAPGPPTYTAQMASYLSTRSRCEILDPEWYYKTYIPLNWYRGGYPNVNALLPCEVIGADGVPFTDSQNLANLIDQAITLGVDPRDVVRFLGAIGVTDVLVAHDYSYDTYRFGPTAQSLDSYLLPDFDRRSFGQWTDYEVPGQYRTPALYLAGGIVSAPTLSSLETSPSLRANDVSNLIRTVGSGQRRVIVTRNHLGVFEAPTISLNPVGLLQSRQLDCEPCLSVPNTAQTTTRDIGSRLLTIPSSAWRSDAFQSGLGPTNACTVSTTVSVSAPPGSFVDIAPTGQAPIGANVSIRSRKVIGDCVLKTVRPVQSTVLRLSFFDTHQLGEAPSVTVLENGVTLLTTRLGTSDQDRQQELYVVGAVPGYPIEVLLYSTPSTSSGIGADDYTNVEIAQPSIPIPKNTLVPISDPLPAQVPASHLNRSRLSIENLDGTVLVAADSAFDPEWELNIKGGPKSELMSVRHVEVNGYANGWIITGNGTFSVGLVYGPRRLIMIGTILAVSVCLVITTIVLLLRKNQRGKLQRISR